jgi:fumarate hydratase subunit beta
MDKYAPRLLDMGLGGMIGKGKRSKEVLNSIIKNKSIYFAAVGGAGALLSKCIKESEIVAYDDLGAEAIRKIKVEKFPAIVVVDCDLSEKEVKYVDNLISQLDDIYGKKKE